MAASRSLWLLLPHPVRQLPADLAAVVVLVAATNIAALAPVLRETPLRVPLGLAFVLFVPGYAFIAALFPEAGETSQTDKPSDRTEDAGETQSGDAIADEDDTIAWDIWNGSRSGIDGLERVALSFGLSIAIVPLLGLVVNFTPWGIRLTPIMLAVSGFTLLCTAVAAKRRWALPVEDRFAVPYREWYAAGRSEVFEPTTRADAALNVLLVLSILLAVGSVGYAVLVPPDGEQFSAIYLLTEDDDGELVADNYPTEFVQGEAQEVIVGVDNHEGETTEYEVVVLEQEVEFVENESEANASDDDAVNGTESGNETVVRDQRELDRFSTTIAANETWQEPYELEPTLTGENVRVVWLLFPGGEDAVPEEPSMDDTEYHVHLWLEVRDE
ncbi:DUF1616 domain-containing protein [Natrialbaceae archaeon GCM10025810]|uniref:DUF1616 domain-containing protein n=1 Tax=Halovalidus salilacus TaxID=3075124 RepID=UPI0036139CA2